MARSRRHPRPFAPRRSSGECRPTRGWTAGPIGEPGFADAWLVIGDRPVTTDARTERLGYCDPAVKRIRCRAFVGLRTPRRCRLGIARAAPATSRRDSDAAGTTRSCRDNGVEDPDRFDRALARRRTSVRRAPSPGSSTVTAFDAGRWDARSTRRSTWILEAASCSTWGSRAVNKRPEQPLRR